MADDILLTEVNDTDPGDTVEHILGLNQAGIALVRKIDLRHIPGDDGFRAESDSGQEHFHLLRSRVLSLVQDNETVI